MHGYSHGKQQHLGPTKRLTEAVYAGDEHSLVDSLKRGADINCEVDGVSVAHLAASRGETNILRLLAAANAKLDCRDDRGDTPLMRAVSSGQTEIAKQLIRLGVDAHLTNPITGQNALDVAVRDRHDALIDVLLDASCVPTTSRRREALNRLCRRKSDHQR